MTGLKLFGFSLAAGGLSLAQMNVADVTGAAKTLENSTPTFVLAACTICFAGTIIALYRQLVKTSERHHEEWASRELAMAAERESRHKAMMEMGEKMTVAMTGVKLVLESCHKKN